MNLRETLDRAARELSAIFLYPWVHAALTITFSVLTDTTCEMKRNPAYRRRTVNEPEEEGDYVDIEDI